MSLSRDDFALALTRVTSEHRWRDWAECRTADPTLFFAEGRGKPFDPEPALELCRRCPVRLDCVVDELIAEPSTSPVNQHGIRGLLAEDRIRLLKWLRAHDLAPYHLTAGDIENFDSSNQLTLEGIV